MSSTTGEHINELEDRRRRREQRNAAQPGQTKPPRSANTAPEARDLLRDLITNGSRPDERSADHPDAGSSSAREGSGNGSVGTEGRRQPAAHRNGEGVDELVRRVQAGAQTVAEEAERATRWGRPIGTADLSADAATRKSARRRVGRRAVVPSKPLCARSNRSGGPPGWPRLPSCSSPAWSLGCRWTPRADAGRPPLTTRQCWQRPSVPRPPCGERSARSTAISRRWPIE
jgi:hypothetical protein